MKGGLIREREEQETTRQCIGLHSIVAFWLTEKWQKIPGDSCCSFHLNGRKRSSEETNSSLFYFLCLKGQMSPFVILFCGLVW